VHHSLILGHFSHEPHAPPLPLSLFSFHSVVLSELPISTSLSLLFLLSHSSRFHSSYGYPFFLFRLGLLFSYLLGPLSGWNHAFVPFPRLFSFLFSSYYDFAKKRALTEGAQWSTYVFRPFSSAKFFMVSQVLCFSQAMSPASLAQGRFVDANAVLIRGAKGGVGQASWLLRTLRRTSNRRRIL
jgi:hypothetical protein